MESKSIYNMDLHEELTLPGCSYQSITRVPGGWLYSTYDADSQTVASAFVPLNDEFIVSTMRSRKGVI